MTRKQIAREINFVDNVMQNYFNDYGEETHRALQKAIKLVEQEPTTDKYEYHTDHTDCIWYGNDSGCPVTCSQYRDGWNDAMEYVYKNGKGYQPYKRK